MRWDILPEGMAGDGGRQVLYIANPIPDIRWAMGEACWQEWARLSVALSKKVMVYDPNVNLFRWLPEKDIESDYSEYPRVLNI